VIGSAVVTSMVIGVHCKNGHFNDPAVPYCSVCGISMTQVTRVPAPGPRPPLGVLILDDGTDFPLERGYVLGRTPGRDDLVRSGRASPLPLADRAVSRVHARVVPNGWDVIVVDLASTNGTWVCPPGGGDLGTAIPAGAAVRLMPGSRLTLGTRQIRYDSYRNP
jgi:FHA domain